MAMGRFVVLSWHIPEGIMEYHREPYLRQPNLRSRFKPGDTQISKNAVHSTCIFILISKNPYWLPKPLDIEHVTFYTGGLLLL
jgi:hypothetical protein